MEGSSGSSSGPSPVAGTSIPKVEGPPSKDGSSTSQVASNSTVSRPSSKAVITNNSRWRHAMSDTMTLRGKASVFAGAALLRLILFLAFPGLPDLLTGRVEISTPVTSFKRCKSQPVVA